MFLVQIPVPGGTTRNSSCVWNVGVWGVRGTPKHSPPHLGLLEKVIITAAVLDWGAALIIIPGSLLHIICLSRKGDTGSNKYGLDPRQATSL